MSWTPEQLDQLAAEAAHKQVMRDAGVDPADPAEREAWEAEHGTPPSDAWAGEPGETAYGRHMRMGWALDQAELDAHTCEQHTCVYCQVTGPAAHFELINRTGNYACRQADLCQLRRNGYDPVQLVLDLARQLAQVARTDMTERYHLGVPGGPEWAEHGSTYRPMLNDRDRARLHLVLRSAAEWVGMCGSADSARLLAKARIDLGCRRCGAMGPHQPCHTEAGEPAREWHAGRRF